MTNLGLAGASSLQALSQWISVIDTNLTNTKRIGYKETRLSLRTNEVETVGKTFTHFGDTIQVPSASLMLDKTLILDYVQGMLTNTENNTDFAIEGKGYFVVEDAEGRRYATRDGQFHFSNDGILVNAVGLKVLSTGQDYIKVAPSEVFAMNSSGTSLNSFRFGDRQLMMIDLPNAGKLYYSKYGFSTFELGNFVPIAVNNNFDTGMDGLNPYMATPQHKLIADAITGDTGITLDSVTGLNVGDTFYLNGQSLTITGILGTFVDFVPPLTGPAPTLANPFPVTAPTDSTVTINYQALYTHNKATTTNSGNVTVDISVHSQALLTAHAFTDFSNSFKFTTAGSTPDSIESYGFNFGQKTATDSLSQSGYFAGIENGFLVIKDSTGTLMTSPVVLPPLLAGTEYEISLSMSRGAAIVTLSNSGTGDTIATANVTGIHSYENTYQSIGTNDIAGGTAGSSVAINSIHIEERDRVAYYDTRMLGGNANKLNSLVRQQYVEESTTTVADSLPILNNAQKLFAAISKIISVSNLETDDLNSLIR